MLGKRSLSSLVTPIAIDLPPSSSSPSSSSISQSAPAPVEQLPATPRSGHSLDPRLLLLDDLSSPTASSHHDTPLPSPSKRRRNIPQISSFSANMHVHLGDAGRLPPAPPILNNSTSNNHSQCHAGPSGTRTHRASASSALKIDPTAEQGTSAAPRSPLPDVSSADCKLDGCEWNGHHPLAAQDPATSPLAFNLPRRATPLRAPSKALSLSIPPGSEAYGGLSIPSSDPGATLSHQKSTHHPDVPASAIEAPDMIMPLPAACITASPTSAAKTTRKRPSRLDLTLANRTNNEQGGPAKSVPSTPKTGQPSAMLNGTQRQGLSKIEQQKKQDLRLTLTGKPRRRPSMPFNQAFRNSRDDGGGGSALVTPHSGAFPTTSRPPEAWRDPSEHTLSGKGSTLQHARSVYAAGPIEVLPGLFLGDEHNARDDEMLNAFGITTILNVAKETVLPFQSDKGVTDLRQNRPAHAAPSRLGHRDPAGRPSMPKRSFTMTAAERDEFYTPVTSRFPPEEIQTPMHATQEEAEATEPIDIDDAFLTPMQQSPVQAQGAESPAPEDTGPYLRSTSSTPNLQAVFKAVTGSDAANTKNGNADVTRAESAEMADEKDLSCHADALDATSSLMLTTEVALAPDAITLTIPPSPISGRTQPMRYIKLPWTHDQTELAIPDGGFAQGCAVIADAMGIDYYGRPLYDESGEVVKPSNVLVHCQCGVSRSATLVIAFVMQAAALNYPWDASKNLTGMHDCYNLVKELSASISPNISLIYQLVEWERHLSAEASRLREAIKAQSPEAHLIGLSTEPNGGQGGWTSEVLDEEEWTRMRREEEAKEEAEEQLRRQRVLEAAKRQAEAKKSLASSGSEAMSPPPPPQQQQQQSLLSSPLAVTNGLGLPPLTPTKGLSARRQKKAPLLRLGGDNANASLPADEVPKTPFAATSGALGLNTPAPPALQLPASPAVEKKSGSAHPPAPLKSAGLQGNFSFPGRAPAQSCLDVQRSSPSLSPMQLPQQLDSHPRAEGQPQPPPTGMPSLARTPKLAPGVEASLGDEDLGYSLRPLRPQSLYASMPSDMGRVAENGVEAASSGVVAPQAQSSRPGLPPRHASTGMQWSSSSGSSGKAMRVAHAPPVSFRARGHGLSNSISSMQSIHASQGQSGAGGKVGTASGLVSPKANFGTSRGLTSAERRQQHRRTFSSEANNASGLINWEQIRAAVIAARDGSGGGSEQQQQQ